MGISNITTGISYSSISNALAAANPGDTINVDPGVYQEYVIVPGKTILASSSSPSSRARPPVLGGRESSQTGTGQLHAQDPG
jgi:hypothetical protein